MPLPRVSLPRMARVRQILPTEHVSDVEAAVREQVRASGALDGLTPGAEVAVTAGSRGVAAIGRIIRTIGEELKAAGARPFVVPAMGSHGGATAEGQVEVLAGYGITEEKVGMPIRATMEVVELGRVANGATVYLDRNAAAADGIVVVGRAKAHTAFRGDIESGLCKMLTVGLGKQRGAESLHDHGLKEGIPAAAAVTLERAKVILGVAVVENAFHQIQTVRAARPSAFHQTDRDLLELSNRLLPRVPFQALDVLAVGWMGKNISGSGMDYNVIGMWRRIGGDPIPNYRRIVVLDLTPESHGNAVGVGMADFTTRKLIDKMDPEDTYWNAITANALSSVKLPLILPTDRDAMEVALASAASGPTGTMACIQSTLELEELLVSETLLPAVEANPSLKLMEEPRELAFDAAGNLIWAW